jgi:hypothetical protein
VGKGLDAQYDLGKLAQPFIMELTSQATSPLSRFAKLTGLNSEDIESAVTSPRRIAYVERTLRAMEQGTLKVRVRALENERALERIAAQTGTTEEREWAVPARAARPRSRSEPLASPVVADLMVAIGHPSGVRPFPSPAGSA